MNIVEVLINSETDLLQCREIAQSTSRAAGFSLLDQVRITTAVSEIVRNVLSYAKQGKMCLNQNQKGIEIMIEDKGPGIPQTVLEGKRSGGSGLGVGLPGSRRLMDNFDVQTGVHGTRITMAKWL